jgi:hypothetical protein
VEFTTEQQQAIWEGWRDGESFRQVGERVGQPAHVIQYFLRGHGGIRPSVPRRNPRHLPPQEREEISRGVAAGWSIRRIAAALGRSHSSVSRELARNGGRAAYRATTAEQAALMRTKRPKPTRLRQRPALLQVVKAKLVLGWSPEQIAAWFYGGPLSEISRAGQSEHLEELPLRECRRAGLGPTLTAYPFGHRHWLAQ